MKQWRYTVGLALMLPLGLAIAWAFPKRESYGLFLGLIFAWMGVCLLLDLMPTKWKRSPKKRVANGLLSFGVSAIGFLHYFVWQEYSWGFHVYGAALVICVAASLPLYWRERRQRKGKQ